jgi:RNA polymerase sigma factor (sigma-70 family)
MEHVQADITATESTNSAICDDAAAEGQTNRASPHAHLAPLTQDSPPSVWEYWVRVAWRIARNRHRYSRDFGDLAQNAVLVLYSKACAESVRYPAAFLVCCILRLEQQKVRSSRVATRNAEVVAASSTGFPTPEENLCASEQTELLRLALERLPRHERESIRQKYYDDLTDQEIARATSTPVGTIKRRRSNAIKYLRGDKILTSSR